VIEIIAEIGVNHGGSLERAEVLMRNALEAGCDTAKFQFFQGDRYPELQLTKNEITHLKDTAKPLQFLCTPDTLEDAQFLASIGVKRIKIGSSNVTNIKMLEGVSNLGLPVLLSTGACSAAEVLKAYRALTFNLNPVNVVVMHCVSAYPPPAAELNLSYLRELRFQYADGRLGYSDHTLDSQSAIVALGMGATVFEKHLTLFQDAQGPDHAMSLDLAQMTAYVRDLREAGSMLGDGKKHIMPCERKNRIEYEEFVRRQW
jgi:sialic acid synthase SpsE